MVDNDIADLGPLVEAPVTQLRTLRLHMNPLSEKSKNIYIPELRARGIYVIY